MDKNELILEIVKKSLEINSRYKNTIFLSFFGHVNLFRIDIDIKGWVAELEPDYKMEIFMDLLTHEEIIQKLKEILEYLEKLEV